MISLLSVVLCAAVSAQQDPAVGTRFRVEGMVVGLDRQPVPACEVWIEDGASPRHAATDGSGRFSLMTERRQFVLLRARVPGRAAGGTWVDGLAREHAFVRVELRPSRMMRGVVRDAAGALVQGAFVSAVADDLPELGAIAATATTAADGSYQLDSVVLGPVVVRAVAPSRAAVQVRARALQEELDLQLGTDRIRPRTLSIAVGGASPAQLARCAIRLFGERSGVKVPLPLWFAACRPGTDRACTLSGLPDSVRLHVEVTVPGAFVAPRMDFVPTESVRWKCRFALLDAPPPPLRGRVVGADGRGLDGVRVLATAAEALWQVQRPVVAVTGVDGAFELSAPTEPGEKVTLSLLDAQWIARPPELALPGPVVVVHDPATVHEVHAAPSLRIRARILDGDGRSVTGAEALLWDEDGEVLGSACTDADGNLRLDSVFMAATDDVSVSVWIAEPAGSGSWKVAAPLAGDLDLGTVWLEAGAALRGRALDGDGVPVPGARVQINAFDGPWQRITVAGADGAYAFLGLPPGNYRLDARRTGRGWGREFLQLVSLEVVTRDIVVR